MSLFRNGVGRKRSRAVSLPFLLSIPLFSAFSFNLSLNGLGTGGVHPPVPSPCKKFPPLLHKVIRSGPSRSDLFTGWAFSWQAWETPRVSHAHLGRISFHLVPNPSGNSHILPLTPFVNTIPTFQVQPMRQKNKPDSSKFLGIFFTLRERIFGLHSTFIHLGRVPKNDHTLLYQEHEDSNDRD